MGAPVINKGTAFWLIASAGLIGVIALQVKEQSWTTSPVATAAAEPTHERDRAEDRLSASLPDTEWFDGIVERPLFSASRRPLSPVAEELTAKPEPEIKPLTLTLAGTLLAGESRIALLAHPTDGLLRLRQGQKVDGWRVDEVREDEVRLRRGPEVTLLSLRKGALGVILQPASGRDQVIPGLA